MCVLNSTGLALDTGILEAATGLEAIGGEKRTFLFLQTVYRVCMLSLFSLYYSANNQLHHYKEETADLLQLIDNLIEPVSSFTKTCKTQQ